MPATLTKVRTGRHRLASVSSHSLALPSSAQLIRPSFRFESDTKLSELISPSWAPLTRVFSSKLVSPDCEEKM
jgi:hypothetical protein